MELATLEGLENSHRLIMGDKSREMRAVVGHNGRKWVEFFHAIGTFLIKDA